MALAGRPCHRGCGFVHQHAHRAGHRRVVGRVGGCEGHAFRLRANRWSGRFGVVKANVSTPTVTLVMGETADPPVSVDEASVWPTEMALAVGHVTVGVALFTSTLTVLVTRRVVG